MVATNYDAVYYTVDAFDDPALGHPYDTVIIDIRTSNLSVELFEP
jgi:hypothetical protein